MSKVATKLSVTSAAEMYQYFVTKLKISNPAYTTKRWKHIPEGEVYLNGKLYTTYTKYKEILAAYNKTTGEKIIKGYAFDLGNGLGNIFAARAERSPNNRKLNMAKSMELRERLVKEGTELTKTNWHVYFNDEDYVLIIWHKGNKLLKHINLYKFYTAGGQPGKGFRHAFSHAVQTIGYLKGSYPYIPCKSLEYIEHKQELEHGL